MFPEGENKVVLAIMLWAEWEKRDIMSVVSRDPHLQKRGSIQIDEMKASCKPDWS